MDIARVREELDITGCVELISNDRGECIIYEVIMLVSDEEFLPLELGLFQFHFHLGGGLFSYEKQFTTLETIMNELGEHIGNGFEFVLSEDIDEKVTNATIKEFLLRRIDKYQLVY